MREEGVVVKEKKCGLFRCLFRLAVVAATVYGAVTAAKQVAARLSRRLEEENDENPEKRYFAGLCTREICLEDEEVSAVDLTVAGGCVTLDLSDAELTGDSFVKIRALGGKVVVKVPTMVRVNFEGKGIVSGFSNMVPAYEDESLPVVYVNAETAGACLKIVMGDA